MKHEVFFCGEWEEQLLVFQGILFHNRTFESDYKTNLTYDFHQKELKILRDEYKLENIAGTGSEFGQAARLTSYFAPKLVHKGDYDNHIVCNAAALLQYSFEQPEHGINCMNKSKILQECCLALGIYARRVWIMPYSPYDSDNHVVNEIYDKALRKWIMLDMTANGYFVGDDKTPLSVLEIRERFALNRHCEFRGLGDKVGAGFRSRKAERIYFNNYFAKNLFYLATEKENGFGEKNEYLFFFPKGFHSGEYKQMQILFRSGKCGEFVPSKSERIPACDISALTIQPD